MYHFRGCCLPEVGGSLVPLVGKLHRCDSQLLFKPRLDYEKFAC